VYRISLLGIAFAPFFINSEATAKPRGARETGHRQ
jgi:hypothetical protein